MKELRFVLYVVKKYIAMIDIAENDRYDTARQQLPYFWRELETRGVRSSLIDAAEQMLLSAAL